MLLSIKTSERLCDQTSEGIAHLHTEWLADELARRLSAWCYVRDSNDLGLSKGVRRPCYSTPCAFSNSKEIDTSLQHCHPIVQVRGGQRPRHPSPTPTLVYRSLSGYTSFFLFSFARRWSRWGQLKESSPRTGPPSCRSSPRWTPPGR